MNWFDMLSWFPENVSTIGVELDSLFAIFYWVSVVIFFMTYSILITFIIKYRKREGRKSVRYHGSNALETTWTILPTILFAGLGAYANDAWEISKKAHKAMDKPDYYIECVAMTYGWNFRYAGADGVLGRKAPEFVTRENVFGMDPTDEKGFDDILTNQLHAPVNRNVVVSLNSIDVLHSFFVPQFRVKQDAVPGNWIELWFNVFKTGKYEIACAELCGSGHYAMRGEVIIESQASFDTWFDAKVTEAKAGLPNKEKLALEARQKKAEKAHPQAHGASTSHSKH